MEETKFIYSVFSVDSVDYRFMDYVCCRQLFIHISICIKNIVYYEAISRLGI